MRSRYGTGGIPGSSRYGRSGSTRKDSDDDDDDDDEHEVTLREALSKVASGK
jgi:hypothetical protein